MRQMDAGLLKPKKPSSRSFRALRLVFVRTERGCVHVQAHLHFLALLTRRFDEGALASQSPSMQ